MRAGGPRLSAGSGPRSPRSSGRRKSREAAPRLRDMSLCFRLLRLLVPGVPPGRAASRVEILQRVIDHILLLQAELEASCPGSGPPEPRD